MGKEEIVRHGKCPLTGVEAKLTYNRLRVNGYKYRLYLRAEGDDWHLYLASNDPDSITTSYYMIVNNVGARGVSR